MPKNKNFTVSFPGKIPLKLKQMSRKKKEEKFHPAPAENTAGLALLLMACYCGSTTMCRRNGNFGDPYQTDS